jgi:hypothetical protein
MLSTPKQQRSSKKKRKTKKCRTTNENRLTLRASFGFLVQYLYPIMLLTNQCGTSRSSKKLTTNTITSFISEDFLPSDSGLISFDSKITWFCSTSHPVMILSWVCSLPDSQLCSPRVRSLSDLLSRLLRVI